MSEQPIDKLRAVSAVERRHRRRTATGIVDRGPKQKTLVVKRVVLVRHPKYHRYVRRTTLYRVHDETEQARPGDTVEIMETRPVSKTKHWRLVRVVSRRSEQAPQHDATGQGSEVRP